ncbi:hypothetical protein ACFW17_10350 [Streptomyces sp. NPDC058961]|uniref:hypothetical protein n=1 Tax=Streptomyces sp. NPDC058961 TaxID=3346680 RepID=UPI0036A37E37
MQRTALAEIACGHVTASSALGREFTRSRDPRVLMSTLRALEARELAERAFPAASAYVGGPPLARVRLTPAGITALASALDIPSAGANASPIAVPRALPLAAPSAPRSR